MFVERNEKFLKRRTRLKTRFRNTIWKHDLEHDLEDDWGDDLELDLGDDLEHDWGASGCVFKCLSLLQDTTRCHRNVWRAYYSMLDGDHPPPFRTWIVKPVQERNVQIYTNKQDFLKPSYKSFLVDPFLKTLYMYVYLYISSPNNLKLRILLNLRIIVAEKYLNPLPKWCEKVNDFKSHINVWV